MEKKKETKKKPVNKPLKCYHCGGLIANERDHVVKAIPLNTASGIRKYKRNFHIGCVSDYLEKMDVEHDTKWEQTEWDKCYFYFKEMLGIPEGKNLDQYAINRLLGLRVGKFIQGGTNVRGLKRGYDFEVILMTMKFCSVTIRNAFETTHFSDQAHKINFAMKIITDNVNFVLQRVEGKRVADKKLEAIPNIPIDNNEVPEYHIKGKDVSSQKVAETINAIMSELNEEDEELAEIDSLFD